MDLYVLGTPENPIIVTEENMSNIMNMLDSLFWEIMDESKRERKNGRNIH